ncbi:MAG: peptidylprolyl isomerase [Gammaproteobacteria bacterium]|nr:MAG: peptidylprolyl isomerase [Gammaproteobacteria bacterium]
MAPFFVSGPIAGDNDNEAGTMLLAIRERITGIIAWVIVGLISIPFVLWGVNEYFGTAQDQFAVKVDGIEIGLDEYDRLYAQNREQLLRSFGGRIPDFFDAQSYLRRQTLDALIDRTLLVQYLERGRWRLPGELVARRVLEDPDFQVGGRFDPERYEAALRAMGLSKRKYETLLEQQMAVSLFQRAVEDTALLPRAELEALARLYFQTRDFEFLRLKFADFEKQVGPIEPEAVEAHYAANGSAYMTEERIQVEYLELDLDAIAEGIEVDEQTLRERYERGLAEGRFRTEERRKARHILIAVPVEADETAVAEKRALAEKLRAELEAGADFAELAKKYSDDEGSAQDGGDLGEVRRGMMVKPFEDALFALEPGKVSEPVRTRFGFHLIRVDEVVPEEIQPFEAVREQLLEDVRREKAEDIFYDRVETLANLTFEHPDSLAPAAEALGLPVRTSAWMSRYRTDNDAPMDDVARLAPVREAAFSDPVRLEGRNSDPIELPGGRVLVLRVKAREPVRQKTLEEAREEIVAALRAERARRALTEALDGLQGQAAAGEALERLAAGHDFAEYQAVEGARRDGGPAHPEVIRKAFDAPKGVLERAVLENGDGLLLRVTAVHDGDLAALDEKTREGFEKQQRRNRAAWDFRAFVAALRENAEIVIGESLREDGEGQQ